jgi:hypothetical protein
MGVCVNLAAYRMGANKHANRFEIGIGPIIAACIFEIGYCHGSLSGSQRCLSFGNMACGGGHTFGKQYINLVRIFSVYFGGYSRYCHLFGGFGGGGIRVRGAGAQDKKAEEGNGQDQGIDDCFAHDILLKNVLIYGIVGTAPETRPNSFLMEKFAIALTILTEKPNLFNMVLRGDS